MQREEFVARVLDAVDAIPPGRVLSYGDVADLVGGGGPRRVGSVLAEHGGQVPWWRVVRADGTHVPPLRAAAAEHWRAEGTPVRVDATRVDMGPARWDGR